MSKHKLLAALPLAFCSLSASADTGDASNLFNEWDNSYYNYGIFSDIPPVLDRTKAVFGGDFYVVDQTLPVELTFVTSQAGYNLTVSIAVRDGDGNVGPWQEVFVKTGNSVHRTDYLIDPMFFSYASGNGAAEIFLKLDDRTNGYTYYSGLASNNPDGVVHAVSFYDYYDGKTLVGFEDLLNGGDRDYDDIVFLVSNVSRTPAAVVPEPETWAMLLAGLGIVGAVARRRKADL